MTVGRNGFDYRLLTKLLFEVDFEPAAAQVLRDGDTDPVFFLASALAKGQGKTEGLHERTLILSGAVLQKLGQLDARALLGNRAGGRVTAAAKMRSNVLFPALKQLALGGKVASDQFEMHVDEMFFDHLFVTLDMCDEDARIAFERQLRELAWNEVQCAMGRLAVADARRLRAISDAERVFTSRVTKNFGDIVEADALQRTSVANEQAAPAEPTDLSSLVSKLSGLLRSSAVMSSGDVAALRRMDARHPAAAFFKAFFRIQGPVRGKVLPGDASACTGAETRWAAIVIGLAHLGGLHQSSQRLGFALAEAQYSEIRFARVIRADADHLADELPTLARFLAVKGVRVDWSGAAYLILSAGRSDEEPIRRHLARDYYYASSHQRAVDLGARA